MSRNGKTSTYGWGAPLPICRSQIAPGGYSRKFYTGRLPLGVEPLTFLYTSFWQKSYPFRIPFIDKWQYPLHKFSLELCIPFNYCKRTFFLNGLKIELKSKRLLQRLIVKKAEVYNISTGQYQVLVNLVKTGMNAQPQRGAFAAFPKQNDKCLWGKGTLGIDWAIIFLLS